MTFFEKFMRHEVNRDDIFSYITQWHKNSGGKTLIDFLGMTLEQYHIFIMEPNKVDEMRNKFKSVGSFLKRVEKANKIK